MKQLAAFLLFLCALLAVASAAGLAGCAGAPPAADATATGTAPVYTPAALSSAGALSANGIIVPARQVQLSFPVSGRVTSLAVGIGDVVQAGQVLATLDAGALNRAVDRARVDLMVAQTQLAQAQATAQAAVSLADDDVAVAQAEIDSLCARDELNQAEAHRSLDKLTDEQRALADAQVTLARAQFQAADARRREALAHRDQAHGGTAPDDVIIAQANVTRAQLALDQTLADQAGSTLIAPFAGTIMRMAVGEGEAVAAGAAALVLADTEHWCVETKDVGELAVGKLRMGQKVQVRVNAFLGQELPAAIVAIAPTPIVQLGDTTYTVVVALEPTDLALKMGMTARVAFRE